MDVNRVRPGRYSFTPMRSKAVRSWGALVDLVGAMLVYGAYHPAQRPLVLVVAGVSKLMFVGLVLAQGSRYLGSAGPAIAMDALFVMVFAAYLWAVRHSRPLAIV